MQKTRKTILVLVMLVGSAISAAAGVSVSIGLPHVSIGINLPVFPELVPVPGYPVYYAPRVDGNYFFYDGMYWVYQNDNWYVSSWYNGPWRFVDPNDVPLFVLRIPVRYYRHHPAYFRGWRENEPPRWGEHWGRDWEQRRPGWDRWERRSVPRPAPLPYYQRKYSGDRYPREDRQESLHQRNYRYEPRDTEVRRHSRERYTPNEPARESTRERDYRRPSPPPEKDSRSDRAPATREEKRKSQPPERGRGQEPQREEERGGWRRNN